MNESPRELLRAIADARLPLPRRVAMPTADTVTLDLATAEDLRVWAAWLNAATITRLDEGVQIMHADATWRGWRVLLAAEAPLPGPDTPHAAYPDRDYVGGPGGWQRCVVCARPIEYVLRGSPLGPAGGWRHVDQEATR